MIIVRCKDCNREITCTNKTQVCGCPNMMTVKGDGVSDDEIKKFEDKFQEYFKELVYTISCFKKNPLSSDINKSIHAKERAMDTC